MKRYTLEELKPLYKEIIYDFIANGDTLYYQDKVISTGKPVAELIYDKNQQLVSDINTRIHQYTECLETTNDKCKVETYNKALAVLNHELARVSNISSAKQKELYAECHNVFMSHSYVIVPLNKRLNALYDSFNLTVVFYDDLINRETLDELATIKNKTERAEFVKNHIELTHIMMSLSTTTQANIAVEGNYSESALMPQSTSCSILPTMYADFNKVTLSDCEQIVNNDLKQMIQERIDMDKENLKVLADMDIKGDNYKLLQSEDTDDIYIRYVCPSTQRVYYNLIDTNYLEESQYFVKNKFDSYLLAWYSINNLFMELTEEELKIPANRC